MSKQIIKLFLLSLVFLILPSFANAEVIFEDDFNSTADWHNDCEISLGYTTCGCIVDTCRGNAIINWDFYNVNEKWNPDADSDSSLPQLTIGSFGRTGKALRVANEAHLGGGGDTWGSDGMIAKRLSAEHQELYIRMWIKYSPTYIWQISGAAVKTVRVMHNLRESYTESTPYTFSGGAGGYNSPAYIYDISWKDTFTQTAGDFDSYRCSPTDTYNSYVCYPGVYDIASQQYSLDVMNGDWHRYDWYLKMNTAEGVADGALTLSVDGVSQESRTGIEWNRAGGGVNGWNVFAIGGNNHNSPNNDPVPDLIANAAADQIEQYYLVDDVVVSTTDIPDDYVIGGGEVDVTPPNAPSGLNVL